MAINRRTTRLRQIVEVAPITLRCTNRELAFYLPLAENSVNQLIVVDGNK
jgi:hypothetical protein